jgi:hypothetical protein
VNDAHLHLLLNHIPVVGMLWAGLLLVGAWIARSQAVIRAALASLILVGLTAIPAYLSGEDAIGDLVKLKDISSASISAHAAAADKALAFSIITACAAAFGLLLSLKHKPLPRFFLPVLLALVASSITILFWTAQLGGEIHHPEIRGDFPTSNKLPPPPYVND